jgi:hypothetical protein
MVDIVKAPGAPKPDVDYGQASQPGVAQMHGVMEKAKSEKRPANEIRERNGLVNRPYAEHVHNAPGKD